MAIDESAAREIYTRYRTEGCTYRDLANEYPVSPQMVGKIIRGEAWHEVTRELDAPVINAKRPPLKPPKNLRRRMPAVCANCKRFRIEGGSAFCIRPEGPSWDAGDVEHWQYVCDRFER